MKKTFLWLFFAAMFPTLYAQNGQQDANRAFEAAFGGGAVATGARSDIANANLYIINTLIWDAPAIKIRPRVWSGGIKDAFFAPLDGQNGKRFIVSNISGIIDVGLTPSANHSGRSYGEGLFTEERDLCNDITFFGAKCTERWLDNHQWVFKNKKKFKYYTKIPYCKT